MNRKNNPMLSLVALVLLAIILVLTCTGCHVEAEAAEETKPAPRFTTEYVGNSCTIITDNETGVLYLAYNSHGIVKLEG
jgi:hypothetical protein